MKTATSADSPPERRPNLLFVLADQLRAQSVYAEPNLDTPSIDRLAAGGMTFTNALSSCPVCTPYRSMLLTGRHPQTTGHLCNSIRTRHSEISIADAFARAGYRTGWIGKWHLHTGNWPSNWAPDFVPEGRDRLGFDYWRGYNMHMVYFNGFVNKGDWNYEKWDGYETEALNRYAFEFLDLAGNDPFCLFLSPHQPHWTPGRFAPEKYYGRLPQELILPGNVSEAGLPDTTVMYRHYLAMILTLDDMLGALLDELECRGLTDNTLVVFTSDHGTMGGAHGLPAWSKKQPYEESILVPFIARMPGVLPAGNKSDTLTAPVDIFPTLCSLCNVPAPRSVEGHDLSAAWLDRPGAFEQDAVLTMNFSSEHDWLVDGNDWRGVRTCGTSYTRRLDGREELYRLDDDPLQGMNLANRPEHAELLEQTRDTLATLLRRRGDDFRACETYRDWYDSQRRVIRNAYGPLGHPEEQPDWSLFEATPNA